MKGFALDDNGDVVIQKKDVQLVEGTALLAQKLQRILSTNRGEWNRNPKEGIPVRKILAKRPNPAMIKDYIRSAIRQVDAGLIMKSCHIREEGRHLAIQIEIESPEGTERIEWEV